MQIESNEAPVNYGTSYGLIAGLIICVIALLQYLGGLDMYLSPIGYISYAVVITMALLAALKTRKANGGYLEFAAALKITFTVFALALLLQSVFTYILFNFIDVSFKEAVAQEVINKTEEMMRRFGAPDAEVEKALDLARSQDQFSLSRIALGYAISCIVSFIICLILSLIVKKPQPVYHDI